MNPSSENSYSSAVTADVTWSYEHIDTGSIAYHETIFLNTLYEVGETETVETDIGIFDAIPVTVSEENSVKKWWLAQGIGIVQFEINTFGFPLRAVLSDTNIFDFSENNHLQKYAGMSLYSTVHLCSIESKTIPNTPERILELCGFLRGLCP